jgi:hypothetical protein
MISVAKNIKTIKDLSESEKVSELVQFRPLREDRYQQKPQNFGHEVTYGEATA